MKKKLFISSLAFAGLLAFSCNKSDFLDAKPNQRLTLLEKLEDYQAILDNERVMNGALLSNLGFVGLVPGFLHSGADEYFVTDEYFNGTSEVAQRVYLWNDDLYGGSSVPVDWNSLYRPVFYANLVLDAISRLSVDETQQERIDRLKGGALFYRAYCYYYLAQVYAPPYRPNASDNLPGIPLRQTADINEKIARSTLAETYRKIVDDLTLGISLLPDLPEFKTRPSKVAAHAMLSKVFLTMHDYTAALEHAGYALEINSALLDYQYLDSTVNYPFPKYQDNPEVIFFSLRLGSQSGSPSSTRNACMDTSLVASYEQGDLRKTLFFGEKTKEFGLPGIYFRGSYDRPSANAYQFTGLALDEVYLTLAECSAREGNVEMSLQTLNHLLKHRFQQGTFTPLVAGTNEEVLALVLAERRKQLVWRGTRWTDMRRLNTEGANLSIKRVVNGQEHILSADDPRWTYLIPPDVMGFNPDMMQNVR